MSMVKPETDLSALLSNLEPRLLKATYVFCMVPQGRERDTWAQQPLATFFEEEGLSVVISKAKADEIGWTYESVYRCITLQVYSSLEAVGLTAAVATQLARAGIGANVIAAKNHDHVFVPETHADRALNLLRELSGRGEQ